MPPSLRRAVCLATLLSIGLAGAAVAQSEPQSMSEAWYVLRGRANMKIGNYKAAIEAFQEAARLNPDNREAMRSLGIAYEKQGLTDKAIEQFDRYLERFEDDPEIAFKQAEYLSWERYAYRRKDAIRYYRMGLAVQEDQERRHRLARLLAQDRERLDEALEQYRILLEAAPDNSAWRAEYRDLLLWDPKHLADAVKEHRRLVRQRPDDFEARHTLARLVARQDPRGEEPVEMYADLVARRPGDAALRLESARVLARHRGRRDAALEQYEMVLRKSPTFETRKEYAGLLSGRPGGREPALEQYALLLRERPGDVATRLEYAHLLGAEREDTDRSIAQYDLVLARQPRNSAAHEGLAGAYAWLGDRDRALKHANLAVRYGGGGDVSGLRESLLEGREPRIEPVVMGLVQRGQRKSELNGLGFGVRGRFDPSPFATIRIESGFEDYWRSGDNNAGGYVRVGGQLRLGPTRRVDAEIAYHSLGPASSRNVIGELAYASEHEAFDVRLGFTRTLRLDSYESLVGHASRGIRIGAAREQRFSAHVATERGPVRLSVEPYTGWVDSVFVGANPFVGLRTGIEWTLYDSRRWKLAGTLDAEIDHYRDDAFGTYPFAPGPLPGGYFSPQLFFEAVPGIATTVHWGERAFLELDGGPALQLVNESGGAAELEAGGYARLSYVHFIRDALFLGLDASLVRISDAYTRVDWQMGLTFEF